MFSQLGLKLLGLAFTSTAFAADVPTRPNILLLFADDQSYKTVRCYPGSYPWAKTPHIDAFAATGVRFDRAYFGSWCMPSRASLLTGRHPHGIQSMRMEGTYPGSTYDPAQCPFWPSVFRSQGYHTAQIGKWHTGTDAGFGRDWDHQIVWNRPKYPSNAGNYYHDQQLVFDGAERMEKGYSTDNYTRWACDYVRGKTRPAGKPWLLWLCYGGVHGPSTPAERHRGSYAGNAVSPPADIFPPRPGKPDYLNKTQAWVKGPGGKPVMGTSGEAFGDESAKKAKTHEAWVQQVNECARSVDDGVGAVLAALQESGQLDRTMVVYAADQGFSMGEHGFRTKLAPYDANYASPLIVRMPGITPAGKVCLHPVNAPDLTVTFHALAGIAPAWTMHGRDLTPLLRDPVSAAWPHGTLYEHTGHMFGADVGKELHAGGAKAVHSGVPWYAAVRVEKLKYVRYLKPSVPEELYDLATDPEELTNLAGTPGHAATMLRVRAALADELRRTGADFVDQLRVTK